LEESKKIAGTIAKTLENKKAKDIILLNLHEVTTIADYFVIASGGSSIQVKALADEVDKKMSEMDINLHHKEGYSDSRWVLLDYGFVVVHIFREDSRTYYDLERLWRDADKINHEPTFNNT